MDTLIPYNKSKVIKSELRELCVGSSEIKILVGFFYFSGIKAFYQALNENPEIKLRILVGTDIERVFGRVVECVLNEKDDFGCDFTLSDNEIRERYLESLRKVASAPEFDKPAFYERIGYFLEMLRADRIVIRRTRGENREKLFLFDCRGADGLFEHYSWITGSSNFTMPGLTTETDIDIRINDCGGEDVNAIFEELWQDSVTLTEEPGTQKAILDIFESESMIAPVTPYEAYILALKMYLDLQSQIKPSEFLTRLLEKNGYRTYRYQLDAVSQALTILREYNGVILADVVGLGKSIIASLVARGLPGQGRGIIIAPPGLIGDEGRAKGGWRDYRTQFRLDWEIFSCGKLNAALEYVNAAGDIEAVLVDEAHRFKNQDTQDYEMLSHICRGRKVILLTATPFNNRPADIFSLLKLFIVPNRSKITLDNHLANRFACYDQIFRQLGEIQKYHDSRDPDGIRRAENAYRKLKRQLDGSGTTGDIPIDLADVQRWSRTLSREIRHILEPVIIRRNRIDLRNDPDYCEEVTELSEMMPPVEQFFELTREQSVFYDRVLNEYFGENGRFCGAVYRPFLYERGFKNNQDAEEHRERVLQTNLYDFMRRLLVRRFESSFGAFEQSLVNFLSVHRKALAFIERTGKFILDRKLLEKIYNADESEIAAALQEYESMLEVSVMPRNTRVYQIAEFTEKEAFLQDIRNDIALFEELIRMVRELQLSENDPKAGCLANALFAILNGTHPGIRRIKGEPVRKVIVFSEYADTILHLERYLAKRFPGEIAMVCGTVSAKQEELIEANFDASYKKEQENQFRILLATDKMSEGHNLNRAGAVINYDIPWNPTRVIQRVGRINRIGKRVFQQLYIFNFFPTEQGASISRSREIAAAKMFMIHNTIGEDARIFDVDETPSASTLYQKLQQNPENGEGECFLTTVKREFLAAKREHPDVVEKISKLPARIKTVRSSDTNRLLLLKRKGLALFCLNVNYDCDMRETPVSAENALATMRCRFEEPRLDLSERFWNAYDRAGKFQEMFSDISRNILSLERRAMENLTAAIALCEESMRFELLAFLRILKNDMVNYGTLSDYTLRRLASCDLAEKPEKIDSFLRTVQMLRNMLGDNYLQRLQDSLDYKVGEIIVAEEFRRMEIPPGDSDRKPCV